jgi:CubicO group peptidase (beta-lactamase class C family)
MAYPGPRREEPCISNVRLYQQGRALISLGSWDAGAAPIPRVARLTLAVLVSLCTPVLGSTDKQTLARQIDMLLSRVTEQNAPGLAVLVKKEGHILFEKGYGQRELRTHANNDPETNFRLASLTKQFTAMAIMLLVHDGKLHYDDRLTDVFPDFPQSGTDITVRHLLSHTSGLPDYGDEMMKQYGETPPEEIPQILDAGVLALMKQQPAGKFPPGTKWEYSDSGYALLAMMVEKNSGQPFGSFLQERIFAPLGMNQTVAFEKGKNQVANRAYGHSKSKNDGAFRETDQSPTSAVLGDGGIYSSVRDLSNWDVGLERHQLLSAKEIEEALTPVKLRDGSDPHWPTSNDSNEPARPVSYGFGWFLDPYKGHPRMWHPGATLGFRAVIERFPVDRVTIIVLSNRTDLDVEELSEKIADLVLQTK